MVKKRSNTNPNGANQYQMDPRQKLCWDYYIDPRSETFSSGLQSALKAGYEQGSSEQITTQDWFVEKLRTLNMLDKAEKVLNDMLEMTDEVQRKVGDELVLVKDPQFTKIKQDTAKFLAERIGKARYSTRTELTGPDGKDLPTPIYSGKAV